MNPCHHYLAVPTDFGIPSGVRLVCKLVEIVRHAAELADVSGMFLRQPFLYMTVSVTFPHVLTRRYAHFMRPCQQAKVVGYSHLYADAIAQLFRHFFFRATALVTFLIFLMLHFLLSMLLLIILYRPTGCHLLQLGRWVASGFGTPETQTCYLPIQTG